MRLDVATDSDISGATESAYTLVSDDEGKTVKVKVSFTDDAGNAEELASTSTLPVVSDPPTSPAGEIEVGTGASDELVVSWTQPSAGPAPLGYKVQWKSGDASYDGSADSTRQAEIKHSGSEQTHTISGLTNGTEYTVRVIAHNAAGEGPASAEVTATPQAPNFIIILADDLGYADVGFNGATEIQTPNIDSLAASGIIFENGYVSSPICSPSRAGLLTGRYPVRFGMEGQISYNPFDPQMGLPLEETIFAEYLSDAGYHNGMFGKWHLGSADHFTPRERGFDYFYGFLPGAHSYWTVDASKPSSGKVVPLIKNTEAVEFGGYLTDSLTTMATYFIRNNQNDPFFLYMAYNAPHPPLQAPRELHNKYEHINNWKRRWYLAMVDSLDQNIGRILETLEDTGIRDNTVIIFLSDQGASEDWGGDNGQLSGHKGDYSEGGIRVPFVASWPSRWPKDIRYGPSVISLDISATLMALANATATDETRPLDGVNLDPYLRGTNTEDPHEALFWRKTDGDEDSEGGAESMKAVRSGNMKLVKRGDSPPELYNLETDISESVNVIGSKRVEATRLANLWNEWNRDNVPGNAFPYLSDYKSLVSAWFKEQADERRNRAEQRQADTIVIE